MPLCLEGSRPHLCPDFLPGILRADAVFLISVPHLPEECPLVWKDPGGCSFLISVPHLPEECPFVWKDPGGCSFLITVPHQPSQYSVSRRMRFEIVVKS
jgi:hypothetical protein